jgi:hypothetical protein
MQISKSFLIVCATACVLPLCVRGEDTDSQKKAREALEQKLKELQSQPASTPAPPPPPAPAPAPKPAKAAPPPAPTPAAQPAPTTPPPAPAQPAFSALPAADPAEIAKAREAVRQKVQQLEAAPAPAAAPAVAAPTPTPAPVAPPPPLQVQSPTPPALPPPVVATTPSADPAEIAKAREAVREKIQQLDAAGVPVSPDTGPTAGFSALPAATPPTPPAVPPAAAPSADPAEIAKAREAMRTTLQELPPDVEAPPVEPGSKKVVLNFPPLPAPPLPISTEKQQKLNALLQRYKVDLISPEQYQTERAKILAGQ